MNWEKKWRTLAHGCAPTCVVRCIYLFMCLCYRFAEQHFSPFVNLFLEFRFSIFGLCVVSVKLGAILSESVNFFDLFLILPGGNVI